jgi:hypothetical protein
MTSVTLVEFALKLLRRLGLDENGGTLNYSELADGSIRLWKPEPVTTQP